MGISTGVRKSSDIAGVPCIRYLECMEINCTFTCVYCFQLNETVVDLSGGIHQEYVEDCQVCCRPNLLIITVDEGPLRAEITAETT